MKKVILFVFLFLINVFVGFSQSRPFSWAKSFEGKGFQYASAVAVDNKGNVYSTGYFSDTADFNPGLGIQNLYSVNGYGYVSKLDAAGNFVWVKQLPGRGDCLKIDTIGNLILAGTYRNKGDFDPGTGLFEMTSTGFDDVYIMKLTEDGNFVWAKSIGSAINYDYIGAVSLDNANNIYLTSSFSDTVDFDPSAAVFTKKAIGAGDIYLLKLDSNGQFKWVQFVAGKGQEVAKTLEVDKAGTAYLGGVFIDTVDFDPGPSVFQLSSKSLNGFMLKINADASFSWAKKIGFETLEVIKGKNNNVYFMGRYFDSADLNPGIGVQMFYSKGNSDLFLVNLDTSGNFIWAKSIGDAGEDHIYSAKLHGNDDIYITGVYFDSTDLDPTSAKKMLYPKGSGDFYVAQYDSTGSFKWANNYGGARYDQAEDLCLDKDGNVYLTGHFYDTLDFDHSSALFNLYSKGQQDPFVLKLGTGPSKIEKVESLNTDISLYPNPCNGSFVLHIEGKWENSELSIFNSQGVLVYQHNINSQKDSIVLPNQVPGLYFVRVQLLDKEVVNGKLVILP
jgi:hypothetical protein